MHHSSAAKLKTKKDSVSDKRDLSRMGWHSHEDGKNNEQRREA